MSLPRCTACGKRGHCRKYCEATRVRPRKKPCVECAGMPWRRARDGEACRCGGFYALEPPVTMAYVEKQQRQGARTMVEYGSGWGL